MTNRRHSPFLLDPGGRALHTESAALRARGAVTKVLLPGGVEAWSVNSHAALDSSPCAAGGPATT
ncbi:hypothetical protein PV410_24325 [Streptomyces sp. PA03-5A]|nr:hypothetical protein [Streptomyces sp. PA03-5A]